MAVNHRGRKLKGDKAEREVLAFLRDHLGDHLTRPRLEGVNDHGDVAGTPMLVNQVKSYVDIRAAINDALAELPHQKAAAGALWGAGWIRRRGGRFLVVMDPEDFVSLYREAITPTS